MKVTIQYIPFEDSRPSFSEVTLRRGCSPVNLLHIFRTPFPMNTSERLLLKKEFLKKLCFLMRMEMVCTVVEVYGACIAGVKWKRYSGCLFYKTDKVF